MVRRALSILRAGASTRSSAARASAGRPRAAVASSMTSRYVVTASATRYPAVFVSSLFADGPGRRGRGMGWQDGQRWYEAGAVADVGVVRAVRLVHGQDRHGPGGVAVGADDRVASLQYHRDGVVDDGGLVALDRPNQRGGGAALELEVVVEGRDR